LFAAGTIHPVEIHGITEEFIEVGKLGFDGNFGRTRVSLIGKMWIREIVGFEVVLEVLNLF
jgi:hypothetical protein